MKFKLYQIKDIEKVNYVFLSFERAVRYGLKLDDYQVVYEGEIEAGRYIEDTLENIWVMFNIHRPEDFKGWSMSVSDIVEIGGEFWYTDSCGFKRINRDLLQ